VLWHPYIRQVFRGVDDDDGGGDDDDNQNADTTVHISSALTMPISQQIRYHV